MIKTKTVSSVKSKETAAATITPVTITPPNFKHVQFTLEGTAPFLQNKFSTVKAEQMMEKMAAGSTSKKGAKREARDFEADFIAAQHISTEGWVGIPTSSIRTACIDVCRMAGFKMTHAKMSLFVIADGTDATDGQPLVKLIAAAPEKTMLPVRNSTGVTDIRVRPMWRQWKLNVTIRFDADQFTFADVANLISRAGEQCGLGEGRPFSKNSNGLGYGTFRIAKQTEE